MAENNDSEWLEGIKSSDDEAWQQVWERVIVPETRSMRSAEMMKRYSITDGDLMSMLYEDMIGRGKIELFRNEGSLEGWLRRYARGYVLAADPSRHGEISIDRAHEDSDSGSAAMEIPTEDNEALRQEAWRLTHYCFRELWNEDPERCYIHVLKTRFFLSSEEIRDFLDCSSTANVDQIFSRSVKFMRNAWVKNDKQP